MSVAGGWFFLMACEMFVLGNSRLPPARPGLLSANRRQPWRHARDSLGRRRHGYRHRAARSAGVAADHHLGGQIQIRTSRELRQPRRPRCSISSAALPSSFAFIGFFFCRSSTGSPLIFTLGARRAAATFSLPKQHRLRQWIGYVLGVAVLVGLGFTVFTRSANCPDFITRTTLNFCRAPRCTLLARQRRAHSRRALDRSRRRGHRFESAAGAHRAAARANRRFHSGYRAFSDHSSFSCFGSAADSRLPPCS